METTELNPPLMLTAAKREGHLNFTAWNNNEVDSSECYGATDDEMEIYAKISFWMEAVAQPIFGIAGFFANAFAIPVLCSPKMRSIFNRLLACLAIYDNLFIIFSVVEAFRRHLGSTTFHTYAFCYFLYPVHNVILCCTIFLPIALALERFRAIRHPVEYHNWQAGHNPWKRVLNSYILPLNGFAIVFCLPKFFESTVQWESIIYTDRQDENYTMMENRSVAQIQSTDFRFNEHYVLWYNNVTRLLVTGLGPFLALVILNLNIYLVIRRRRHMTPRLQNAQSAALKDEAARQSYMLFVICGLFLLCHILRLILAIHELFVLDHYRRSMEIGCYAVKLWTLVTATVSQLLLTLNSSTNFAVYCLMSSDFRKILREWTVSQCERYFGSAFCLSSLNSVDETLSNSIVIGPLSVAANSMHFNPPSSQVNRSEIVNRSEFERSHAHDQEMGDDDERMRLNTPSLDDDKSDDNEQTDTTLVGGSVDEASQRNYNIMSPIKQSLGRLIWFPLKRHYNRKERSCLRKSNPMKIKETPL